MATTLTFSTVIDIGQAEALLPTDRRGITIKTNTNRTNKPSTKSGHVQTLSGRVEVSEADACCRRGGKVYKVDFLADCRCYCGNARQRRDCRPGAEWVSVPPGKLVSLGDWRKHGIQDTRTLGTDACFPGSTYSGIVSKILTPSKGKSPVPPTTSTTSARILPCALIPDYSWNMLIRASNPAFSCGRSPVSLEPLSIRLNRFKNRMIEPVINRLPARRTVTRRQVDFPARNPHRFGPLRGPDSSAVHYPGAQDTRASLFHNRFQSVAP